MSRHHIFTTLVLVTSIMFPAAVVAQEAQTPPPAPSRRSSILNIALSAFGGGEPAPASSTPVAPAPAAGSQSRLARNAYRAIALVLSNNLKKAPTESTLRKDFHGFFGSLKSAATFFRDPLFDPGSVLPAKVDTADEVAQFNQFLVQNSKAVLMAVVPFEMPRGMDVRDAALLVSARDPNVARIDVTVALAKDVDFSAPLGWMNVVPLFRSVVEQARFVVSIREKYGKIPLWGRMRILITKTAGGLRASLQRVRVIAGTTDDPADDARHAWQIEIPEAELKAAYARALEESGIKIIDRRFDIPGVDGHATITSLAPSFGWDERARIGSLDVDGAANGRFDVAGGIDFSVLDLKLRLQIYRRGTGPGRTPEGNRWYVYGNATADLDISDRALGLLSGFGARLATNNFSALSGKINEMIGEKMTQLGLSYISGMAVENLQIATRHVTFRTSETTLDVDALVNTYFGRGSPVLVDEISFRNGKMTLGGRPQ